MAIELTVERVRELLNYDQSTGVFTRRVWCGGTARAGSVAGSKHNKGYLSIMIDGKHYYSHRLAWFIATGSMPSAQIDHINGIKDDNRIANLREASNAENMRNRGANLNNALGLKGVFWDKVNKKWRASITLNGKAIGLGRFTTPEAAHAAYCRAANDLHGDFVNHGSF